MSACRVVLDVVWLGMGGMDRVLSAAAFPMAGCLSGVSDKFAADTYAQGYSDRSQGVAYNVLAHIQSVWRCCVLCAVLRVHRVKKCADM